MDIVTLGAALNGSAEYVNSHFVGGSNIQIVDNPDGTQTINASGEVSAEDTVARADIAAIKDGETLDSFGDVETALATKANTATTYTKTEVDTALDNKVDKVSGKGLSTNDYTTTEKTKLAGIAEGAEVNEIEGIKVNNTTINPDANKVVNITVPTSAADVSALPDTTKYAVALSLTINSSTFIMTGQLKDQNGDNLGTAQTIDLPLESVVVGGSYNSQTKKVVLTLQNGNTIEFSVADLVSGLQTELSASNKLNPAYIEYDSAHRAVSDTEKSTWNSKQNALTTAQLAAVNSGIDSTKVEQIETNKSNILTVADQTTKYNICDYTRVTTAQYPDSSTGATISFDSDNLEYTINGTTNSTGTLLSNIYFDTATTKAIPNGEWVAQIYPPHIQVALNAVATKTTTGTSLQPLVFSVTADDTRSWVRIELGKNITFDNYKFKLMIIPKSLWDAGFTNYQPYALSNAELTAKEQANENNISMLTPTVAGGQLSTTTTDYSLVSSATINLPSSLGLAYSTLSRVTATYYSGAYMRGLILSKSNNSADFDNASNIYAKLETTDNQEVYEINVSLYNSTNNDIPVYIWLKNSGTGGGRLYTSCERLR